MRLLERARNRSLMMGAVPTQLASLNPAAPARPHAHPPRRRKRGAAAPVRRRLRRQFTIPLPPRGGVRIVPVPVRPGPYVASNAGYVSALAGDVSAATRELFAANYIPGQYSLGVGKSHAAGLPE